MDGSPHVIQAIEQDCAIVDGKVRRIRPVEAAAKTPEAFAPTMPVSSFVPAPVPSVVHKP